MHAPSQAAHARLARCTLLLLLLLVRVRSSCGHAQRVLLLG
jgi:hypothetical protein